MRSGTKNYVYGKNSKSPEALKYKANPNFASTVTLKTQCLPKAGGHSVAQQTYHALQGGYTIDNNDS